jgi:hypothetical protein
MTIVLFFVTLLLFAELPPELRMDANPDLYSRLMPLAQENLSKLPKPTARAYRALLSTHDDILMAYLVAYEQDSKLAEADPGITKDNYLAIARLLEQEGLNYAPEFFLSYIARQSVSDERLSPYRNAMLEDGLAEVLQIEDPLTRYRETANWCVEKLLFMQTSGRDQSPLDISRNSLTGRCEEMQILFVAAARTVGLPSRPASTPWWAHMDNNHAWAEVFMNEEWHYTGDMDAAYFPNQTWFSGMIDKTVMILAEGSLAAQDDEVLINGRYETVINSTPNYAGNRTRRVEVICLDESGKAMADAQVGVMVYNWGALRSLIVLKSDADGRLGFSAGSGDFYLSAFKDGKQALEFVKASAAKHNAVELVLKDTPPQGINQILEYPANEMDWQDAPEAYRAEVQARKQLWQNTIDLWEQAASSSSVPDSIAILTRGNLSEFERFWNSRQPIAEAYISFLMGSDPKFLWQADAHQFEAHYRFWQEQNHDLPPELFYPSVFYEELPRPFTRKGQTSFYPPDFVKKGKNPTDRMHKALKWQRKKYRINSAKALSGLPRLDIMASQKYLSDIQFRLLAIYILRANGIPAEFTRLPNSILVYLDEDWHYYNLKEGKLSDHSGDQRERGSLLISLKDEYGVPISGAISHLTPTRYVDGMFYNINAELKEPSAGTYRLELPAQDIHLFFGYRISDSKTALQMLPISAGVDSLTIVAQNYPREWENADEDLLLILAGNVSEDVQLVVLGNHDQENSLRVAQKLIDQGIEFTMLGHTQQGSRRIPGYVFSPTWQSYVRDDPSLALRTITLYRTADGWKMYDGLWDRLPLP